MGNSEKVKYALIDEERINKIFDHIEIYNREMGGVQADLINIKDDIAGIRTCVNTISGKVDKAITDSAKALPAWAVGIIGLLTAAVGWLLK